MIVSFRSPTHQCATLGKPLRMITLPVDTRLSLPVDSQRYMSVDRPVVRPSVDRIYWGSPMYYSMFLEQGPRWMPRNWKCEAWTKFITESSFLVPEGFSRLIDGIVSVEVLLLWLENSFAQFLQIVRFTFRQQLSCRDGDVAKETTAGRTFDRRNLKGSLSGGRRASPITLVFPSNVRWRRQIFEAVRPTFSFWQRERNNSNPNMRISWPYNVKDGRIERRSFEISSSRTIITSGSNNWNLEIRYISRARSLGTVSIFIFWKTSIEKRFSVVRHIVRGIQPLWLDRMAECIHSVWSRLQETPKNRHRKRNGRTDRRNSFDKDVLVPHYPTGTVDERDQRHKSPERHRSSLSQSRIPSLTSVSCVLLLGNVTSDRVTATNGGGGAIAVLISMLVISRSGAVW